jgi:glycosyltransferase involved in cell wall biosynthesis
MSTPPDQGPVDVVLCIDREVYTRLWEVIRHLCVGLVDLNARVRLLSSSPEVEALTLGPIQTIVHPEPSWPFSRQRVKRITESLAARRPGIVHALAHGSHRLAQALARSFGVDLVAHVTATADVRGLRRLAGQEVQQVIAASGPLFEAAGESHCVPDDAVALVRPGMLRSEAPTCFTEPGRAPTLLCTASLEPDTGVEQLLYAIRLLRDRGQEVLAFCAGGGSREGQLRRLVRRQGISQWVTFARPKAETGSIMTGADIWVSPAPEHAIQASSLLAMATGTAVVTCAGGVTDHCVDGRTAVVCPNGDPEALADGIERLLRDRSLARDLAAAGLAHLKEHHAVSNMAEQVMALYRRLRMRRQTFSLQG